MQRAHVIANRFTARQKKYKGVRNAFTNEEWQKLLDTYAVEFNLSSDTDIAFARRTISKMIFPMCAECHEEVLSEPFYLPSFLKQLRLHFEGKTRIDKMIVLSEILKLGLKEYNKQRRAS